MNFATKLIVTVITIATTVVGSIWGGFELLDLRMDRKVSQGEQKVMALMGTVKDEAIQVAANLKSESELKVQVIDQKFMAEISGVKTQLTSMDSKLNILIGMAKTKVTTYPQITTEKKLVSHKVIKHDL